IWGRTHQTIAFVTHDISEAILLSQQVWVMSYRPGTIIDVIDDDLPEERDASIVSTHEFNEVHNRIWSSLQAESMRGFQQQEKSACWPLHPRVCGWTRRAPQSARSGPPPSSCSWGCCSRSVRGRTGGRSSRRSPRSSA